jgi:uncharacterized membrane protein (UPF0136 family)
VVRSAEAIVNLFVKFRNDGQNHREQNGRDRSGGDHRPERDLFAVAKAQAHLPVSLGRASRPRKRDLMVCLTGHRGSNGLPIQMIGPAKIYFIIFGLLTIVGGVIGYVKAGSTISIVTGAIAGVALLASAFLLSGNMALGLVIAGLVSVLLAGRFIPHLMKTGKLMPDGLMAVLGAIGVVMAIVAWIKK